MEVNTGNSRSNEKQSLVHSKSTNEEKRPAEKESSTPVFVNYAAIAWHESRKKWVGDQRVQRIAKDPIIRARRWYHGQKQSFRHRGGRHRSRSGVGIPARAEFTPWIWSTAYEDLLSTHDSFPEPIPLTEMVDFLVDIWLDEGLFD